MELFVSDLDGTLLNKSSEVSKKSCQMINDLIQKGVKFTVATARTHATVIDLLAGLNIQMPIVIMNGAGIYDLKNRKYIEIVDVSKDDARQTLKIMDDLGLEAMVYGIKDNQLSVFYRKMPNQASIHFYDQRKDKPLKQFVEVESFESVLETHQIVNMLVFDRLELIEEAYRQVQEISGVKATSYRLREEGFGYMEIHSSKASKANGIKALAKYADFDKIIGFGDNLNDLPMFELADEAYAPLNAVNEIKEIATGVIRHHNEDAIARYIKERYEAAQK